MKTKILILGLLAAFAANVISQEEFPRVNAVVKAVRKSGGAVVNISTERVERRVDPFYDFHRRFFQSPFDDFFQRRPTRTYTVKTVGSGVVIDSEGYIITNEHVIHGVSKIMVSLPGDETQYEAALLSAVPEKDLALIRVEADHPLMAIEMGDSDDLMIGETTIALGNPYGLENTVTTGVVSARKRSVYSEGKMVFDDLLQTDAAINPGNSGGALLDINGRLIGINTAIKQGAEGIGFAIPVNDVKRVLKELLSIEKVKGIWLGLKVAEEAGAIVKITEIDKDSPAQKAGIEVNDEITAVNGKAVANCFEFHKAVISAADKGMALTLKINGKDTTVTMIKYGESLISARCGFKGRDLNRLMARRLRIALAEDGVLVTDVFKESPAAALGLEVGDVVVKIDDTQIKNLGDVIELLAHKKVGDKLKVVVIRGDKVLRGEIALK